MVAALGSQVDEIVGGLDDIEVVFDDEDGVSLVAQFGEDLEELLDVGEVEAGGRFVQDVECMSLGPA
ncbi:MAG: hypothetical protein J6Y80_01580 [Victivallales bacterium]|nr:hypothetical protein [Victivallales bacterium]